MVDLIDDFNQRQIYGSDYPQDRVSGYTIRQVEDALNGGQSFNEWKNNIKNKYNNDTEKKLDEGFDYWASM